MTLPNAEHLHEQLRALVGPDAPFVFVLVDPDEPPTDDSGIGSAGATIIVQRMTALQVAATLSQLTTACLTDVARQRAHDHLVEHLREDHVTTTLDELLRRIEDAIDATSDERVDEDGRGVTTPTERTGPAILRAVLEQPLPDLEVCLFCRGIGHLVVEGTRSRVWCRPCNGIGYVERTPAAPDPCPVAGCGCGSITNHEQQPDPIRTALAEVLATFTETTWIGEPVVRSTWQPKVDEPTCWLCSHPVTSHIRSCHVCGCLAHYARSAPLPAPPPPVVT